MNAPSGEELVFVSAIIFAIGLITFGMIISYRKENRDEPEIGVNGVRIIPTGTKASKKEARRRADLLTQVAAERRRSADLATALSDFHHQLHASNPMTPYRWAELHRQTHRDLDTLGIYVSIEEEEDAGLIRRSGRSRRA